MSIPIYTQEQYLEGLRALTPLITIEVLVLMLNQDPIMYNVIKLQKFEKYKLSLEDAIDKCKDWMLDRGLYQVTTPEQRHEAAIQFLNPDAFRGEHPVETYAREYNKKQGLI